MRGARLPAMSSWASLIKKLSLLVKVQRGLCTTKRGMECMGAWDVYATRGQNILVPQHSGHDGAQMPQTVRINHALPRRKVHQLQTHRRDDPRHADTRQHRPRPPNASVLYIAEAAPEQIRNSAHDHVCRHVVRVVPAPQGEIRDVRDVEEDAQRGPKTQEALLAGLWAVEAEDADRGVVEAVEDVCAGSPVVEFLGEGKIARVEEHAEGPACEADIAKGEVVFAQRVRGRDPGAQLRHAPRVREVVEQREDDAEGLLHAHEAVEGPFAVELVHGLHIGRVAGEALRGYDVLACVVAFGGTVPKEQAAVQGWWALDGVGEGLGGWRTYGCWVIAAIGFFADLQELLEV
jgi:hypothetical protein